MFIILLLAYLLMMIPTPPLAADTMYRSYPGSTSYRLISCSLSAECTFLYYCIPHIDILYFRMFGVISSVFCSILSTYLMARVCTLKVIIFIFFLHCNNFALASRHVSISPLPVGFKGATSCNPCGCALFALAGLLRTPAAGSIGCVVVVFIIVLFIANGYRCTLTRVATPLVRFMASLPSHSSEIIYYLFT